MNPNENNQNLGSETVIRINPNHCNNLQNATTSLTSTPTPSPTTTPPTTLSSNNISTSAQENSNFDIVSILPTTSVPINSDTSYTTTTSSMQTSTDKNLIINVEILRPSSPIPSSEQQQPSQQIYKPIPLKQTTNDSSQLSENPTTSTTRTTPIASIEPTTSSNLLKRSKSKLNDSDKYDGLSTEKHARLVDRILHYNIEYPKCQFSVASRRNRCERRLTLDEKLDILKDWKNYSVIAIDGQNGTTKSTLCSKLRRKYLKVNLLAPEVTCGSNYNYDPLKSLEYLSIQLVTRSRDAVWDRCMYSNLIFYYIHHLMYHFQNNTIPLAPDTVWPILNALAYTTNLAATIDYCRRRNNIPTLFLVCSNIDYIATALRKRFYEVGPSAINDLWNSKEYNYQMAQYHVYTWFGKLLDYPVFDLQDFFLVGYSLNDIHTILASYIDRPPKEEVCELPDRTAAKKLTTLLLPTADDVLIYEFSRK